MVVAVAVVVVAAAVEVVAAVAVAAISKCRPEPMEALPTRIPQGSRQMGIDDKLTRMGINERLMR